MTYRCRALDRWALLVSLTMTGAALAAMERGPTPVTAGEAAKSGAAADGAAAARAGDCKKALPLLEKAVAAADDDADSLNLLAYCQRKSGKLDEALVNYRRALEIRPDFPAAREYLGEAHVQAAMREVEVLRSYGDSARQELADLVAALRAAAEAAANEGGAAKPPPKGQW